MSKKIVPVILMVVGLGLCLNKPISGLISSAKLDLKIQPAPAILPAIYKVYANENALEGKYSLFKMQVTNNSSSEATDVEVSYQIPNLIDWKPITKFARILPGQTVVVNCYPSLPEKLLERTTTSKEQVNIKVSGNNISTMEENFAINVRGRNDFMYTFLPSDEIRTPGEFFDNMPLLSCLVTPQDPIIKYFTQQVQEKVLKGETASVTNKDEEGVRFMLGLYNATLMSHMVYSGTTGVPAKIEDVSSIIQSIRLPREVVTGKTGLCIELSLLYASVMASAGMDPIVYLIPGHAYPGFRMNGHYYAIESTGIGGEGMGGRASAEDAYKMGMKNLNEFFQKALSGDDRYMIVDVREAIKNGAEAIELKDDAFLRGKIDEIARDFVPKNTDYVNNGGGGNDGGGNGGGGNGGGGNNGGGNAGYNQYQGVITFSYPSSWRMLQKNQGSMPQVKHLFASRDNNAYIEVYNFQGYNNPDQAMYAIQQFVASFGGTLQYQRSGQTNNGYIVYNGSTYYDQGGLNWVAAFKQTGNGVAGLAIGANAVTGTRYQSTVMNILNTLQ